MMKTDFLVDKLRVLRFNSRLEMASNAASSVEKKINELLELQEFVNLVFAAAPSQSEFLNILMESKTIHWKRINALHMDEYVGLSQAHPQSFSCYLNQNVFKKATFNCVHFINGANPDPEDECKRYSNLLSHYNPDIVLMGIGENGHIAFNDPHVADFNDNLKVKIVELDLVCRTQQVNDGCFSDLSHVPTHAITLTIPALMNAKHLFCIVPAKTKAQAVFNTLNQPVIEKYPATALRNHPSAMLFLDNDSSALLKL